MTCLVKGITVLLLIVQLSQDAFGQREKKFFRKDYNYIENMHSFYKIQTIPRTWSDAKKTCMLEGATLFYPFDQNEADAVLHYWNQTQTVRSVFVGISSLIAKGVFETLDGVLVTEVYNKWAPGEPNDAGGAENCVTLNLKGEMNDDNCDKKFPFICKKTLASLEWDTMCNIPDMGYVKSDALGKCYKLHVKPQSWSDAYGVCGAEQSYLAVLDSQAEAEFLVNLTEQNPNKDRIKGKYLNGVVYLGFHNRFGEGWQTIKGEELEKSGYNVWADMRPDGEDRETCGSMLFNGRLNDVNCTEKSIFICEHDVDSQTLDNRQW